MMFKIYDKKDKRKFLLLKGLVILLIIGVVLLAFRMTNIKLPSVEEKMQVGIGFILASIVGVLAIFNLVGSLFKFKSIGFLVTFLILLLLRNAIDVLVISLGLVLIPLLINDLAIDPYFKYLNMNKYWNHYKYIVTGAGNEV